MDFNLYFIQKSSALIKIDTCWFKLIMILRTRIKELRARLNLTQDELAEIIGVSRQTMLYLEKGKYNPSLLLAYKVAKALKSSINEVFIIEDDTLDLMTFDINNVRR